MKTIILQGQLGKLFGRRHRLAVKTAGEAVRALIANFPAIERYLIETKNVGYRIKLHDTPLFKTDEMHYPVGGPTIIFTPIIAGSKDQGIGTIIIGSLLVAAAVVGNVLYPGNPISPYLMNAGIAMIMGGTVQMLSPAPKTGEPKEREENKPSYNFNGPVNTTAQGQPVPIGYGRLLVGGAVISAGLTTEEIPV